MIKNPIILRYLIKENIYSICDFLTKQDMTNFKCVSSSIALIIFDIMKCYRIGIFNMNELIDIKQYKSLSFYSN